MPEISTENNGGAVYVSINGNGNGNGYITTTKCFCAHVGQITRLVSNTVSILGKLDAIGALVILPYESHWAEPITKLSSKQTFASAGGKPVL